MGVWYEVIPSEIVATNTLKTLSKFDSLAGHFNLKQEVFYWDGRVQHRAEQLRAEALAWCEDQFPGEEGSRFYVLSYNIVFLRPDDALMFKLRWC